MLEFYVSAPGKVILFGEHSAVYGKPAIAAALSLRAYLLVQPTIDPNEIVLEFPDIGLVHRWDTKTIPWAEVAAAVPVENGVPVATDELVPELLDLLPSLLEGCALELHYTACRCFLYLYFSLCGPQVTGCRFCVRLTLPIGAGLGSSALTAVCLAAALASLGGHVEVPENGSNQSSPNSSAKDANFIDAWSFMGEKCFHGNPSGIDNAVATHGGAVMYQRLADPGTPAVRTAIRNFAALRLLLINTKVPRSTAKLVAGVSDLVTQHPQVTTAVLDAMGQVATDAHALLMAPQLDKHALQRLVQINHGLLVALGVSHPSLEQVRMATETHALGATKLTGAGGGGCAITLVNDDGEGAEEIDAAVARVSQELVAAGFETFQATLGGSGVGILRAADVGPDASKLFTAEFLAGLGSRDEVEAAVGASTVPEWRFW